AQPRGVEQQPARAERDPPQQERQRPDQREDGSDEERRHPGARPALHVAGQGGRHRDDADAPGHRGPHDHLAGLRGSDIDDPRAGGRGRITAHAQEGRGSARAGHGAARRDQRPCTRASDHSRTSPRLSSRPDRSRPALSGTPNASLAGPGPSRSPPSISAVSRSTTRKAPPTNVAAHLRKPIASVPPAQTRTSHATTTAVQKEPVAASATSPSLGGHSAEPKATTENAEASATLSTTA